MQIAVSAHLSLPCGQNKMRLLCCRHAMLLGPQYSHYSPHQSPGSPHQCTGSPHQSPGSPHQSPGSACMLSLQGAALQHPHVPGQWHPLCSMQLQLSNLHHQDILSTPLSQLQQGCLIREQPLGLQSLSPCHAFPAMLQLSSSQRLYPQGIAMMLWQCSSQ